MVYTSTGGSSGFALGFYRTPEAFSRELASKAHQYHRVGWREGDRQMVLRGVPVSDPSHMEMVPELCELRCSSYHLSESVMESYRQRAFVYKPQWLRCYPSSGYRFARFLLEHKKAFPPLSGILVTSEDIKSV